MAAWELKRDHLTRFCLFGIDGPSDISMLPTSTKVGSGDLDTSTTCAVGSIARASDGSIYTLTGDGEWELQTKKSSGGGGGGPSIAVVPLSVTANGTYTAPNRRAYSPVTVNVASGGSAYTAQKDVNFFDCDGTILHSYTKDEFLALTSMPDNPSKPGLIAQGWNWTLADAKAYVGAYGILEIGQMYTTSDGKTRVYIHIEEDAPENRRTFSLYFGQSEVNGVSVDWGDGTEPETYDAAGFAMRSHAYAKPGDYTISLTLVSGVLTIGTSSGGTHYSINGNVNDPATYLNRSRIRKVEIGNNMVSIGEYAFYFCLNLSCVSIPSSIQSIGGWAFYQCYMLNSIAIPAGITSLPESTFQYCYTIKRIAMPASLISIGDYALANCYVLERITTPGSVTSIGNSAYSACRVGKVVLPESLTTLGQSALYMCEAITKLDIPASLRQIAGYTFYGCYGMSEYHMKSPVPPTLVSTTAFGGMLTSCTIYVPYSSDHSIRTAYRNATNWSSLASRIEEEGA